MIGGGYYTITGSWDWRVVIGSLPYALGVTGVIFGKHIDKFEMDKSRRIFTLPVVLGEQVSRYTIVGMLVLQYLTVVYLVVTNFFSALLLIVFLALRTFARIYPMFKAPKPDEKPQDYPDVWPNYFVAAAFVHNREFGMYFLLGIILDVIYRLVF
jgi:1,4-dihydroxy-2-naphthoate octaprenyltransferase